MARSRFTTQGVAIAESATTSDAIDARSWDRFGIIKPATTGNAITFTVSTSQTGTFTALLTTAGTSESLTTQTAAGTYPLPTALERFPWFKLVSDETESAARVITVTKIKV